jgi:uridylate kinase
MINYKRILLKLSGEALSDNRQKLILELRSRHRRHGDQVDV